MKNSEPTEIKPNATYSRNSAAETLGLSPRALDYCIKSGELNASKVGRRVVILGRDMLDLLSKTKIHK
jgi:hypothetical protein